MRFDKSTDVSDCAQFVAFVHFEADDSIMEDVLFCKAPPPNTFDQYFYMFLESTCNYENDWKKCIANCNDSAKAMNVKIGDSLGN